MTGREYREIHRWINRHYPRTGRCEWCGNTTRKTNYATSRPGTYTRNRADWFEFCRRCHCAYDGCAPQTRAKMSAARRGREQSAESITKRAASNRLRNAERNAAIRAKRTEGVRTVDLAREYGLSRRNIRRIVGEQGDCTAPVR